jgi:hypothetical protein
MLPFGKATENFDQPVYIIGGGSSLVGFDFGRIKGNGYRLGVNKSAFWAECDGMFSLDQHFVRMHRNDIQYFVNSGGDVWLAMPTNEDGHKLIDGATYIIRDRSKGLSSDPRYIYGVNSGYGALNLAFLKRAPSVALLGLDMQYGKEGQTHFHDGYSWHNPNSHRWMCRVWSRAFDLAAIQCKDAEVEVINYIGNPPSKITAFPTAPLDDL